MITYLYTFITIFISILLVMAFIGFIRGVGKGNNQYIEGEVTAAMCTTKLLESGNFETFCEDDFIIEQDMVYTYDSFNL